MDDNKKAKILAHIDSIIAYAKQPGNEWLLDALIQRLSTSHKEQVLVENNSSDDIRVIREYLSIRGNLSISYDFVKEQRLRDQLRIDNLRMENAAINLKEKEIDRFYVFCVNAFYQVENTINYYFHVKFPNVENLLDVIEENTKKDGDYCFKRKGEEGNVSDIQIFYKINAICSILFPNDKTIKSNLSNLRKVRNEGEHRCQVIYEEKDDNNYLYRFLQKQTFNSVRISLIKLVKAVQMDMSGSLNESAKNERREGVIKTLLPSACFVSFGGETIQVSPKLFSKVRERAINDKIKGVFNNGRLVDVE